MNLVVASCKHASQSMALKCLPLFFCVLPCFASGQIAKLTQPTTEAVDRQTVDLIRDEGMNHSHIMEYASGLFDGVGSRLTGSPDFDRAEEWSMIQLRNMGASNVHAESWDDFGMGWQHLGTSLELTAPGTETFVAQATPWSPATAGVQSASVIAVPAFHDESEFVKWKGKLDGKIILYGRAPKNKPDSENALEHYDKGK